MQINSHDDFINRGFWGLHGVSYGETPFPKPLQGMGYGPSSGYSGFYFNYREIFLNCLFKATELPGTPNKKIFERPKKTLKTPKTPFCHQD